MKESRVAWILVAIIPVLKWTGTLADNPGLSKTAKAKLSGVLNRQLFHRCMSIITRPLHRTSPHDVTDPDGHIRCVLYVLWAYIADLEEQLVIASLGSKCCPHCQTQSGDLDNQECRHERTSKSILDDIKKVTDTMTTLKGGADLETAVEFLHKSKKYGLCGIKFPFWATIPGVDIAKVLSIDLLHGFYKCFYDHIFKWNLTGLTPAELDAQLRSQIQLSGDRAFLKGASHMSQTTMKEHRDLLQTHVATVAEGPNGGNSKVMTATHAIADCIYLARLDLLSAEDLHEYSKSYAKYHENKSAWIKNESCAGKNGVIDHFNIPKLHNMQHVPPQVVLKGAITNYSTETMERLHIDFIKDGYRASNRRKWLQQLIRWVEKHEQVRNFHAWLAWQLQQAKSKEADWCGVTPDEMVPVPTSVVVVTKEGGKSIVQKMPHQQCPQCGQALGSGASTVESKKRKREDNEGGREDGRATRVKLVSSNHGTSSLQIVNMELSSTNKTLSDASEMLGDPRLVSMVIQSTPELATPAEPINEDTRIHIWDQVRIQVSNNLADDLHWVRVHPKLDETQSEHPDPVFYLSHDVSNPTTPRLHGTL
ncbi:hypothetical protein FRC08_011188 [Ceratobasidium sp. 394]|nr:hypothetical protein FRC08_011188 [Ceratobasidium sp. 394]